MRVKKVVVTALTTGILAGGLVTPSAFADDGVKGQDIATSIAGKFDLSGLGYKGYDAEKVADDIEEKGDDGKKDSPSVPKVSADDVLALFNEGAGKSMPRASDGGEPDAELGKAVKSMDSMDNDTWDKIADKGNGNEANRQQAEAIVAAVGMSWMRSEAQASTTVDELKSSGLVVSAPGGEKFLNITPKEGQQESQMNTDVVAAMISDKLFGSVIKSAEDMNKFWDSTVFWRAGKGDDKAVDGKRSQGPAAYLPLAYLDVSTDFKKSDYMDAVNKLSKEPAAAGLDEVDAPEVSVPSAGSGDTSNGGQRGDTGKGETEAPAALTATATPDSGKGDPGGKEGTALPKGDQDALDIQSQVMLLQSGDNKGFWSDRLTGTVGDVDVSDDLKAKIEGFKDDLKDDGDSEVSEEAKDAVNSYDKALGKAVSKINAGKYDELGITFPGDPKLTETTAPTTAKNTTPETTTAAPTEKEEATSTDNDLGLEQRVSSLKSYPSGELPRVGDLYESVTDTPWRLRNNVSAKENAIQGVTVKGDKVRIVKSIAYRPSDDMWYEASPDVAMWVVVKLESDRKDLETEDTYYFMKYTFLTDPEDWNKLESGPKSDVAG